MEQNKFYKEDLLSYLPSNNDITYKEGDKVKVKSGSRFKSYILGPGRVWIQDQGITDDEQSRVDRLTNTQLTKLEASYSKQEIDNSLSEKVSKETNKSLVNNSDILKLQGLKTQDQIDNAISSSLSLANAGLIEVPTTTLPRGTSVPSYINAIGKAELTGGDSGQTYTNTGNASPNDVIAVAAGTTVLAYYNRQTDKWTKGGVTNVSAGTSRLPLYVPGNTYAKDAQVRDANGIIYASLKDGNASALTVKADWGVVYDNVKIISELMLNLPTDNDINAIIKELYIDTDSADKTLYPDYDFNNLYAVKLHGFGIDTDGLFKVEFIFYKSSTVYFNLNFSIIEYGNQLYFSERNGIKVYICVDKTKLPSIAYALNITLNKDFVFKVYRNPTINLARNGVTDSLRINSEVRNLYLNLDSYSNIAEFNSNKVYVTTLNKLGNNVSITFKFGTQTITKTLTKVKDDMYVNESDTFKVYLSFTGNRADFNISLATAVLDKNKARSKADNISVDSLNYVRKSTIDQLDVTGIKSYVLTNSLFINDAVKTTLKYDIVSLIKEIALVGSRYKFEYFYVSGVGIQVSGSNFTVRLSLRGYVDSSNFIEYYRTLTYPMSTQEDLFIGVNYTSDSNIPNDDSVLYVVLDINKIKDLIANSGGIATIWGRLIDVDKNKIVDDSFYPRIKKYFLINSTTVAYDFKKIIKNYLPNPNNGVSANTVNTTLNIVDTDVNESIDLTNAISIHLSDLLTNSAISSAGVINDTQLYQDIKTFFDANVIDTNKNQRLILRLIIFWQASGINTSATLVDNNNSPDGKSWIWMPSNMFTYLKGLANSLLTLESTYSSTPFPTTNYIAVPDFRNLEFRRILDKVFEQIALYLEETVSTPSIYSSNNSTKVVKKGDYIAVIQARLIGPWGEGNTKSTIYTNGFYPYTTSDVDTVITYFELYKKHFSKYNIQAHTFGARRDASNAEFDKLSYYLLTTTYGNTVPESDGKFIGSKEFGMFIDHMTNSDTGKDFSISYNGVDLKTLALKKYTKAQVSGENGSNQDISTSIGIFDKYAKEYRYSNITPWGVKERWNPIGLDYFNNVVNTIGYRLGFIQNLMSSSNGKIQGTLQFFNLGLAYCYDNFWKIQLVERRKDTNAILQIVDVSDSLFEISKTSTSSGMIDYKNVYTLNVNVTLVNTNSNLFLRVIDTSKINENMHLYNINRTSNGEYCINSRTYNVVYNLDGGKNSPNNLTVRNLYEDMILKPAYKQNSYFDGWYLDSSFTKRIDKIDVNVTSDITVYAKFK